MIFSKKITFCAIDKEMVNIWPHPKPASRFIPDEFKKLSRFYEGNLHDPKIKTCRCLFTTFLPIALADTSLSRIARIILPQGEFNALLQKYKIISNTDKNKNM